MTHRLGTGLYWAVVMVGFPVIDYHSVSDTGMAIVLALSGTPDDGIMELFGSNSMIPSTVVCGYDGLCRTAQP